MRSLTGLESRLDELLAKQPAARKAALVFAYLARGDTVAADKVAGTLATEADDTVFTARLCDLSWMGSIWSAQHWRQRSFCHALHASHLILVSRGDPRADEAWAALCAAELRLVGLDAILDSVCAGAGLTADDVRKLSGVTEEPYTFLAFFGKAPDHAEVDEGLRDVLAMLAK